MKVRVRYRFREKTAFFIILLFIFRGAGTQAEEEEKNSASLFGEIGIEYSDNVFGLTADQISTMNENDPDNVENGRYKGMDSLTDYKVKPRIGINWETDSPFWGKLRLISWLQYNNYLMNDDSDYPEGKVILKNSIGEKGSLIFEGNFIYGYRKKNYLSGAVDTNENGNIPRDEREYSSAIYNEYEGTIGYRHELIKDKDHILSELYIKPFAGFSTRDYNAIFENRDRDILFGGLELDLEFINKIDLKLSCKYENISSPGDLELILYDETISGVDTNGDDSIRQNAPLYTSIDRSSERYTFELEPSIRFTKDIKVFLGYSKWTSKYTSDNPFDIEHYKQKAYREKYKSGISYDLSKAWKAEAEYCRTEDEDPEDGIYKENNYLLTVRYKF